MDTTLIQSKEDREVREQIFTKASHWISKKLDCQISQYDLNAMGPESEYSRELNVPRRLMKAFSTGDQARRVMQSILEAVCVARYGKYPLKPARFMFGPGRRRNTRRLQLEIIDARME